MKKILVTAIIMAVLSIAPASAENVGPALNSEEFERWPYLPEYTVLNPFPLKGNNCTWFAHGRLMQLGYCTRALNSMRFNAHTWAGDAAFGAVVSDEPMVHSIAYWDRGMFFNSSLGHVAVVEEIRKDGSILVSDSSVSGSAYRTYEIEAEGERWPCAFIIVPESENRSTQFLPDQKVQTTAHLLYFRLEGADQSPVLLPEGTVARIVDHGSNGIYAPRPRSSTAFYYWWYAEADVDGEIKHGWMAESYLEEAPPGSVINTPRIENDDDQFLEEKDRAPDDVAAGEEPGSDREEEPASDNKQDNIDGNKQQEQGQERDQSNGSEVDSEDDSSYANVEENEDEKENEQINESEQSKKNEIDNNNNEADNEFDGNPKTEGNENQEPVYINGDVCDDGQVNARDVVLTMHHMMRIEVLGEDQARIADVNKDGIVDIRDVVLMMKYVLRLVDSFD